MGSRILKKTICGLLIFSFVFASRKEMRALAAPEEYPLLYGEMPEGDEPVVTLLTDEEDYTVLSGDSLWKIAEKLWGNGNGYVELAERNKELIVDPNLIYPGMTLKTAKSASIVRREAKYGGIQMGDFSMDMPHNFRVGILESGDAFANFALFGDGGVIACLIQDRQNETVNSVKDWEQCRADISEYVQKNYSGQVSDLNFEHYTMTNQGGFQENYIYILILGR